MTIKVGNGGGGGFQLSEGITYTEIAAGVTGVIFSRPEVEGKVYRIVLLASSTTSTQVGISLVASGITLADEETLMDNTAPAAAGGGSLGVFRNYTKDNTSNSLSMYDVIECKSFELIKNAGNTLEPIDITYELGEYVS